ncbi:MAG: hypothetical protein IPL79_03675 [Myxococcales bacterium]|nr:hypothetical protein [Myxococcales bacterium]
MDLGDDIQVLAAQLAAAHEWLLSTTSPIASEPARRANFESARGKVFQEETLWETWCQLYVEWCAIDAQDLNARQACLDAAPSDLRSAVAAWLASQRTLCEFSRLQPSVRVVDVLRGATFEATTAIALAGVQPGDLAEVRLVGFGGRVWLGPTMLFHARAARTAIARQCQDATAAGAPPERIMDALAQLLAKVGRYSHMPAHKIYALDQALADRGA